MKYCSLVASPILLQGLSGGPEAIPDDNGIVPRKILYGEVVFKVHARRTSLVDVRDELSQLAF